MATRNLPAAVIHVSVLLAAAAVMTAPACTGAERAAEAAGPQYLLFQIFTYSPAPAVTGDGGLWSNVDINSRVDEILSAIGPERGDHLHRQLGFVIGPLAFDMTDAQIRAQIDAAFAVAEEDDVAVGFHIDDSMFWKRRRDLWSNRNNVEWSDWQGTPVPHRIIGWAAGGAPILAPPMCYNSPAIVKEATRLATDVIGAEIEKGVAHLYAIGKPYLFAGVIAGWETRLQDDSGTVDGYCALHNLGYTAQNPPANLDAALIRVVKRWIVVWDQGLQAAGIARDRIYTHIAFPGDPPAVFPSSDVARDFYKDSPPEITAFNAYSCPGFTVYGAGMYPALYKLLGASPEVPWGISEGTAITLTAALGGGSGSSSSAGDTDTMEQYLAGAFHHGASYVDLFGWGDHGSAFDRTTTGNAAIAAYRKFLRGDALRER